MMPLESSLIMISFSLARSRRAVLMRGFGGRGQSVMDGSRRPVRALKRGSRWRGQSIRWKSWGAE